MDRTGPESRQEVGAEGKVKVSTLRTPSNLYPSRMQTTLRNSLSFHITSHSAAKGDHISSYKRECSEMKSSLFKKKKDTFQMLS